MNRSDWRAQEHGRLGAVCLFVGLMVVYALTMPKTVTLEDSGLFLLQAHSVGIGHPPGYALYGVLAGLFAYLPTSSPAVSVHLFSSVCAAASCVVLWRVGRRLGLDSFPAWLGAAATGVSLEFWGQAVIAEVYSLVVLLFVTSLWGVLCVSSSRRPRLVAFVTAHLVGLGLSLHWPLFVLSSPALILMAVPDRSHWRRLWASTSVGVVLGLWPWAWMVVRSHQAPLVDHYGPINSLSALWFMVSRAGLSSAGVGVWPEVNWADKLGFAWHVFGLGAAQFGYVGSVAAVVGLVLLRRRVNMWRWWAVLAGVGVPLLVLVPMAWGAVGFVWESVFEPFPLLAWTLLGLGLGSAIHALMHRFRWSGAVALVGIFTLGAAHFSLNNRHSDTFAQAYATAVLDSVEPDAVLFLSGDADVGPVGYRRLIEGYRPDVRLLHDAGLVFSDRLFPAGAATARKRDVLAAFVRESVPPVYAVHDLGTGQTGPRLGLVHQLQAQGGSSVVLSPHVVAYWQQLVESRPSDPWARSVRADLLRTAGTLVGESVILRGEPEHRLLLQQVSTDWHGALGILEACAASGPVEPLMSLSAGMEPDVVAGPALVARHELFHALLLLRSERFAEAVDWLIRSTDRVRDPGALDLLGQAFLALDDAGTFQSWFSARSFDNALPPSLVEARARWGGLRLATPQHQ